MKKQTCLLMLTTSLLLSGCGQSEPTHDVQYYLDHPDEMNTKIKQCENNPGELMKTPNCQNAMEAHSKKMLSGEGEMPKIKVPDKW